jgi:phytanoyl-CoA hydroxylase
VLLSVEELKSFNENGFLLLRNFADTRECDAILEVANVHLKDRIEPIEWEGEYNRTADKVLNRMVRRLRQVYHRDIRFQNWMENKKIRPILKQVLGENPVITLAHHNSIMTKMPRHGTQTGWHQDKRYWNFENDNLVSVWLSLGDEDYDNGVLEFIPQSHNMVFCDEAFGEYDYFRDDYAPNQPIIDKKVSFELHKGDVVLFHCKTLHRANANSTNKAKISFVYTVKGESNGAIMGTRSAQFDEIYLS